MLLLQFYRKNPFFRLLVFYAAGLIAADLVELREGLVAVLFIVTGLLAVAMVFAGLWTGKRYIRGLFGVLLFAVLFSAGLIRTFVEETGQNKVLHNWGKKGVFQAVILEQPEIRSTTVRTTSRVTGEVEGDSLIRLNFKAILYIERDSLAESLKPGTNVIFLADMSRVWLAGNPGEFDYRKYLANRKVYLQTYIASGKYRVVQTGRTCRIRTRAALIRQALLGRYRELDLSGNEFGVLSALTLGYRNDLDAQTENTFVHAGVMHIMALSGFHIGVVALLLSVVMSPFKGTKAGRGIRLGMTLSALWFFSVVSGLSTSVIRAALMFSLALPGRLFGRKVNVYNMLFASTLVMLTIRPGYLADTGFQLSFLAVAGIAMVQPLLRNTVKPGFFVLDYMRKILVISFAAQIATLPVTLRSFHQFPVYFWLSNLFVIPLAALVMYTSLLYLALWFVKPLAYLVGKVVVLSVRGLLLGVTFVEKLPGSLQEGIDISGFQSLLLLFVCIFFGLFFMEWKNRLFLTGLAAWLAFMVAGTWRDFQQGRQKVLSVHNISDITCINLISGRDCLLLVHPDSLVSRSQLDYSFGSYWAGRGVYNDVTVFDPYNNGASVEDGVTSTYDNGTSVEDGVTSTYDNGTAIDDGVTSTYDNGTAIDDKIAGFPGLYCRDHFMGDNLYLQFHGTRLVVLKDGLENGLFISTVLDVDLVVVTGAMPSDLDKIVRYFSFGMLILDSSVGYYKAMKWTELCHVAGVKCWNVADQGAFILTLGQEKYQAL